MADLTLVLVDPNLALCEAFKTAFDGLPDVEVAHGFFEQLPVFDCMVSAANSFGLMDGGVDAAITRFFGARLMQRVQERILTEYLGEQPVGTAMIVETKHVKHPYIAHAPTMRVPQDISMTDNVYVAMWAMLLTVRQHNRQHPDQPIRVVACPGLGTGTGKVPYEHAARQMALAYRHYLKPPTSIYWQYASQRQVDVWLANPPLHDS